MDSAAVTEVTRAPQQSFLTPEALQAAIVALVPGTLPSPPVQPSLSPQQQLASNYGFMHSEQANFQKLHPKRKGTRAGADEVSSGGPRLPPIKHEVYEDLEELFNQLQSEREPKRHRGNPKGYQIKSFCKNPACGKQLNGGRTNRCEHCGFDLASHRRNAQLERLIKSGPLVHTQVRTSLRDAANEVHVRTGGKAVVLTLLYIEGATTVPTQAIAYGKPAAAFLEARKDFITSFETACKEHFRQQAAGNSQPEAAQDTAAMQPLPPIVPTAGATAAAQGSTAPRTCALGPSSQFLSAFGAAATAAVGSPCGSVALSGLPLPSSATPVDLDSVITSTLSDPGTAIARCRDARLSGDVLARLPQAMQLTVLMQAGLLAGEAASVVVELESRQKLMQLPALTLAAMAQPPQQQQPHVMQPAHPHAVPQPVAQQPQSAGHGVPSLHQQPVSQLGAQEQMGAIAVSSTNPSLGLFQNGTMAMTGTYAGGVAAPIGQVPMAPAGGVAFFGPLQAALMAAAGVGDAGGMLACGSTGMGAAQVPTVLGATHTGGPASGLPNFGAGQVQAPGEAQSQQ